MTLLSLVVVFFFSYNKKYEVTLLKFRDANVTVKSVNFIYVLRRPQVDHTPLNSPQQCFPHIRAVALKEGGDLVYDRW
jgi:hypothetical protein